MSEYDKKVYEEELKDFLPENIVDSHTHVWRTEDDRKNRVLNPDYWPDRVGGQCSIEDLEQTYFNMFPDKKVVPVIFGWPAQYLDSDNHCEEERRKGKGKENACELLYRYGCNLRNSDSRAVAG